MFLLRIVQCRWHMHRPHLQMVLQLPHNALQLRAPGRAVISLAVQQGRQLLGSCELLLKVLLALCCCVPCLLQMLLSSLCTCPDCLISPDLECKLTCPLVEMA